MFTLSRDGIMSRRIWLDLWVLAIVMTAGQAWAATTSWKVATGSWFTGSNWTAGEPTGATDAIIDNNGTSIIDSSFPSAAQVIIGANNGGTLEMRDGANPRVIMNRIHVARKGHLLIPDGRIELATLDIDGLVKQSGGRLGHPLFPSTTVSKDGVYEMSGGQFFPRSLDVAGRYQQTGGKVSVGPGEVTIDGPNTAERHFVVSRGIFNAVNRTIVGETTSVSFELRGGSSSLAQGMYLSGDENGPGTGHGHLLVKGANTVLDASNEGIVGYPGSSLSIYSRATVRADILSMNDAIVKPNGTILPATAPDATVTFTDCFIAPGEEMLPLGAPWGVLNIDGDLGINGGRFEVTISGLGLNRFDRIEATGVVGLLNNPRVTVEFVDRNPRAGDSWTILKGALIGGAFDFTGLPNLGPRLMWTTDVQPESVTLKVEARAGRVPEPGAASSLLVVIAAITWRVRPSRVRDRKGFSS
jgi:hypothetical protein